ncbi:hypothetical protein [Nocardia shimofusensis]|uniref:hypothetical protein n=1 Tax=Nocardia shimofusensis TaxID=228596 RepID=UPI000A494B6D|nr:hypothetical protein [Nocardia shimofusensis]
MSDELYVDQAAIEGMIGVLTTSQQTLDTIPTQSFFRAIETALPGSGLGHSYMKAGWRAGASARGVGGQLEEINNAAVASLNEYKEQQQRQATSTEDLADTEVMREAGQR